MPDPAQLVQTHGPMVWRTLWRLVGGHGRQADVADGFQDVFVAALETRQRMKVQNWEAMLRRIATTRGLDLLRARLKSRTRIDALADPDDQRSESNPPGRSLEQQELADELRRALASIPPDHAEIFCLRHVEALSYEAIASLMNSTPGAVGVTLHRAKERLRQLMNAQPHQLPGKVPHD